MSDYEAAQRKRNIIVGIFVVAGICAFAWLIYKFGELPVKVGELRSYEVFVHFPTAQGVQRNTPVMFCGYQVGRVTSVEAPSVLKDLNTGHFYYQTRVVLSIDKEYDKIPKDVVVKLMKRGLGSSYVELKVPPFDVKEPQTEYLKDGSLMQGSTGLTSEFFPEESQQKLDELVSGLRDLIVNANTIIGDAENKEHVKTTLANLSEASKKLDEFLSAGTTTLKNADAKIDSMTTAMVNTSEELDETLKQLRLILVKINDGQGSAGRFINDGKFYENLLENTEQLEMLLEEIKSMTAQWKEKGLKLKLK